MLYAWPPVPTAKIGKGFSSTFTTLRRAEVFFKSSDNFPKQGRGVGVFFSDLPCEVLISHH